MGGRTQKDRAYAFSRRRTRKRQRPKMRPEVKAVRTGATNQLAMMGSTPLYLKAGRHGASGGEVHPLGAAARGVEESQMPDECRLA